jgi:hypothetical protein
MPMAGRASSVVRKTASRSAAAVSPGWVTRTISPGWKPGREALPDVCRGRRHALRRSRRRPVCPRRRGSSPWTPHPGSSPSSGVCRASVTQSRAWAGRPESEAGVRWAAVVRPIWNLQQLGGSQTGRHRPPQSIGTPTAPTNLGRIQSREPGGRGWCRKMVEPRHAALPRKGEAPSVP